jgi:peptidoglycan/xylan/chitin deacetylase (PgdA/CDA1 family)
MIPVSQIFGYRSRRSLGILMYHRISEPPEGLPRPTHNVTPQRLRQQLGGLLARGYKAWPLDRLLEFSAHRGTVPLRAFAVTFDDGYETFYRNAWPILRDLHVPAMIFLPTAYIGSDRPLPFDQWSCAGSAQVPQQSWRPLSWDQCDELVRDPLVAVGAHTHNHLPFYSRPEELESDLTACMQILRTRFGGSRFPFALPLGVESLGFSMDKMKRIAEKAGASCALTTEPVVANPADSPFAWGRFEIEEADSTLTIAVRLNGWYRPVLFAGRVLYRLSGRRGGELFRK